MNNSTKKAALFASTLLIGCGGGDEENSAAQTPVETVIDTQDITAQRDFSFSSSGTITVSVNASNVGEGALHLYTKAAFTDENGEAIADPSSLLTTIYPNQTSEVELEIDSNWEKLYAQWVPMSAEETEQQLEIDLNQSSNSYHLDL